MKNRIIETTCPPDSILRNFLTKIDFEDAFAFRIPENRDRMEEVYSRIFYTTPQWVMYALQLRNVLVKPFGLKTEVDRNQVPVIQEGEKAGIFRIYRVCENEVIAGEDDRHLNFRVSVHRTSREPCIITVSTVVQYNNLFGKMYMTLISPFHRMVVKSILKGSVAGFAKKEIPAVG